VGSGPKRSFNCQSPLVLSLTQIDPKLTDPRSLKSTQSQSESSWSKVDWPKESIVNPKVNLTQPKVNPKSTQKVDPKVDRKVDRKIRWTEILVSGPKFWWTEKWTEILVDRNFGKWTEISVSGPKFWWTENQTHNQTHNQTEKLIEKLIKHAPAGVQRCVWINCWSFNKYVDHSTVSWSLVCVDHPSLRCW
jgi:hypothetical protein